MKNTEKGKEKGYVVFNGDEGVIAAYQVSKHFKDKFDFDYVSGHKYEMDLVKRVKPKEKSTVYVLDLNLPHNIEAVEELLKGGHKVVYVDHHKFDRLPKHENFDAYINTEDKHNTSTLVNEILCKNKFDLWAVVGAYGDEKSEKAEELIKKNNVSPKDAKLLKRLGKMINYNSFKMKMHPEKLIHILLNYDTPFEFIKHENEFTTDLAKSYTNDLKSLLGKRKRFYEGDLEIHVLPESDSAESMFADVAYRVQKIHPNKKIAILCLEKEAKDTGEKTKYNISIRAPSKAHEYARKLGGGRETAAGASITQEKNESLEDVVKRVASAFK